MTAARETGTRLLRHECTENDNHLVVVLEDGVLDEIQIGTPLAREGRAIIGAADLRFALHAAGYEIASVIKPEPGEVKPDDSIEAFELTGDTQALKRAWEAGRLEELPAVEEQRPGPVRRWPGRAE